MKQVGAFRPFDRGFELTAEQYDVRRRHCLNEADVLRKIVQGDCMVAIGHEEDEKVCDGRTLIADAGCWHRPSSSSIVSTAHDIRFLGYAVEDGRDGSFGP
jgi:hypothetical protein